MEGKVPKKVESLQNKDSNKEKKHKESILKQLHSKNWI